MATDSENTPQSFGAWLKAKREARNMKQEVLAELADCSQGYISNLERNYYPRKDETGTQPNKELVIRLAQILKASETEALEAAGYVVQHPDLNSNQLRAADLVVLLPTEPTDRQEEAIRELEVKVQLYGGSGGGAMSPTSKAGDEHWTPPIGKAVSKKKVTKKGNGNSDKKKQGAQIRRLKHPNTRRLA